MQIIKEVELASRKAIRYMMFRKRDNKGISLKKSEQKILGVTNKEVKAILNFYEGLPDFMGWEHFEIKWDIGMGGDLIAIANRSNKEFLFKYRKDEIVPVPFGDMGTYEKWLKSREEEE